MSEKVEFEGGSTRNSKRPMYELIPLAAKEAIARRMELGIKSHGKDNYKSGGPELFAETARHLEWHLNMYLAGDQSDSHLDAVIANASMLCWWEAEGKSAWLERTKCEVASNLEALATDTEEKARLNQAGGFTTSDASKPFYFSDACNKVFTQAANADAGRVNNNMTGMIGALAAGTRDNAKSNIGVLKDVAYGIIKTRKKISTKHLVERLQANSIEISAEPLHQILTTDNRLRYETFYSYLTDAPSDVWSLA